MAILTFCYFLWAICFQHEALAQAINIQTSPSAYIQQQYKRRDKAVPSNLKGFSWFGFNTGNTMVEGLWGRTALSTDFATVVYRQQLLGFNAVRLPFSFKDLFSSVPPRRYDVACVAVRDLDIAKSNLLPGDTLPKTLPKRQREEPYQGSICNSYLPNDSTLQRFLWTVKFYADNGFKVLIDDHYEDHTVKIDPNLWITRWTTLVQYLVQDANTRDHVMFDLLNEPDSFGLKWEDQGNQPGMTTLYLRAMDAIDAIHPRSVFFIEGCGQSAIYANWGDGFATNAALIAQHKLSNPTAFFKALKYKPYRERVVISPHVYGRDVTHANAALEGKELWQRLSRSFGYLNQTGFQGMLFPVAIGEFGSLFTNPRDAQTMVDLARYLRNEGPAKDYQHRPIDMWFYWDWNPTSGDTGGLVQHDWETLEIHKIAFLRDLGLQPF
jgi:aryl-phospho-beta-D-glucosidase BglC (GH1 family)